MGADAFKVMQQATGSSLWKGLRNTWQSQITLSLKVLVFKRSPCYKAVIQFIISPHLGSTKCAQQIVYLPLLSSTCSTSLHHYCFLLSARVWSGMSFFTYQMASRWQVRQHHRQRPSLPKRVKRSLYPVNKIHTGSNCWSRGKTGPPNICSEWKSKLIMQSRYLQ